MAPRGELVLALDRMRRIMEDNYMFNLSLEAYARMCGRSLSAFKRDFQQLYQAAPGRWLREQRLRRALQRVDRTVLVIDCDDPAYEGPGERVGEVEYEALLAAQSEQLDAAPTRATDPCFWLYSSGSTGAPKGTVHIHSNLIHTAELYGQEVLGIREQDVVFSAAKLFFAEKGGWDVAADSPTALLGVVAIYEARKPEEYREYWWSTQHYWDFAAMPRRPERPYRSVMERD